MYRRPFWRWWRAAVAGCHRDDIIILFGVFVVVYFVIWPFKYTDTENIMYIQTAVVTKGKQKHRTHGQQKITIINVTKSLKQQPYVTSRRLDRGGRSVCRRVCNIRLAAWCRRRKNANERQRSWAAFIVWRQRHLLTFVVVSVDPLLFLFFFFFYIYLLLFLFLRLLHVFRLYIRIILL